MTTKVSYGVANIASQVEAEAGTAVDKFMTPQRATQAMTARIATQVEAEAGTDATQFMTPERAAQALVAQAPATAQIVTFSADSELTITPNVVDGIYRITGMLYGSVNNLVLLQTSDDGGTNYTDTSGDVFNCWRYYVYGNAPGSISSSYSGTAPGFYLDVSASSTAFRFDTFSAVLAFNGVDRVSVLSTACEFSGAGNIITTDVAGTTGGNHDSGIDRIRITTDTGTLTGTVIVENLRLS